MLSVRYLVVAAMGLSAAGAMAADPAPIAPARSCESLVGLSFYNVPITAAVTVPAANGMPAWCKVTGTEQGTKHDLEVRLPERWLGRYVQRGGGGFDGSIPPAAFSGGALRLGAVQGANNGGHRDPTGAALLGDVRAIERYAHGAILTATRFGKAVTQAYYGRAPAHSYYEGCSNGGRGAFNAAAKYGPEFDGIVSVAPTMNLSGQIAAWTSAAALSLPSREQFAAIHAAAAARCDADDGARDGIISRWQRCAFDPAKDIPKSVGLTSAQLAAVQKLLDGWQAPDGSPIYAGYGYGDMAPGAPAFAMFGTGQMRSIVLSDANWSPQGFDPVASLPRISAVIDGQYQFSATPEGLAQFLRGGGKMMLWHGSDDALLSHKDTIRTWERLGQVAGEATRRASARFYIAPGVAHCAGGPGADGIDALGALVNWVEQGQAPGTLEAVKRGPDGAVKFSRPLCEYPAWPKYRGTGDVNSAASFACVTE